jgi:hypothetical protein
MHLGNFDKKDLATTTTNNFPLFFKFQNGVTQPSQKSQDGSFTP